MTERNINPDLVAKNPTLQRLYQEAQAAGFNELQCTEIIGSAKGLLDNPNRDTWEENHPEFHDLLKDLTDPSSWSHDWLKKNGLLGKFVK